MLQWGFILGVWFFNWYLGFPASQTDFAIGCTVGILYQWGWPKILNYFQFRFFKF